MNDPKEIWTKQKQFSLAIFPHKILEEAVREFNGIWEYFDSCHFSITLQELEVMLPAN